MPVPDESCKSEIDHFSGSNFSIYPWLLTANRNAAIMSERPFPARLWELARRQKLWHLVLDMPQRRKSPSANPVENTDPLAESVDRLSAEVRVLRDVLSEIREDLSWVTRNGLPIQPVEHVHVRRMARDVNAADWNERLVVERTLLHPPGQFSAMGSVDVERITEELRATVQTLTHGQLLPGLKALDEVRAALLAAMQQDNDDHEVGKPQAAFATLPASQIHQAQPQETHAPDVKLGRLF